MPDKVMPSPSSNLYERSMNALISNFENEDSKPAMDYIVGSFLDSLQEMPKQNKAMMINSHSISKEFSGRNIGINSPLSLHSSPMPPFKKNVSVYDQTPRFGFGHDATQVSMDDIQLQPDYRYMSNVNMRPITPESRPLTSGMTLQPQIKNYTQINNPNSVNEMQLPYRQNSIDLHGHMRPVSRQNSIDMSMIPVNILNHNLPNENNMLDIGNFSNSQYLTDTRRMSVHNQQIQHHNNLNSNIYNMNTTEMSSNIPRNRNNSTELRMHSYKAHDVYGTENSRMGSENNLNQYIEEPSPQPHLTNTSSKKHFQCEKCPQSFSRSHDLKRHMYIHSQDKPFGCVRCGRGFSRRDALKRHEKSLREGKKVHCVPLTAVEKTMIIQEY